ncbi:DUF732 domain-containing protein [Mycobacterium sp. ACS4331]|uniref:DUF732 domain-containing protein n=1 Tax=Mycobacterium sp. ACS4331 TaxID=1834121 RepID=UPI00080231B8|nr:DUF732 domain-containing protein [Mycobacterium sp. ACS4331]OBF16521.1 hypothetical protein A5727_13345 [Mycobacterium sp. ACS4331]
MTLGRAVVLPVIAVSALGWLTPVAPAHADDDSYLTKLRRSGVVIPLPEGSLLHSGQMVCSVLHRGLRPEHQQSRYFPAVGMPEIIAAAQTELCPDTLA